MASRFVSGGTILPGSDGSTIVTADAAAAAPLNQSGITSAPASLTGAGRSTGSGGGSDEQPPRGDLATTSAQHSSGIRAPASETPAPEAPATLPVAPLDPANEARQAEWAAVQASLDAERRDREARRRAEAQGDGEKSLFAILQDNKAAKQAKFDEANALRNQFPTLGDDEIDFLDGLEDGKRAEEQRRRREVEEGLAAFREAQRGGGGGGQQKSEAIGDGVGDDAAAVADEASLSWEHSGRKRKREKDGGAGKIGGLKGVKRKTSVPEGDSSKTAATAPAQAKQPTDAASSKDGKGDIVKAPAASTAAPKAKVGLVAYGSDDSDDD